MVEFSSRRVYAHLTAKRPSRYTYPGGHLMSPTLRGSRIVEGLLQVACVSALFLAFWLGLHARLSTWQGGFSLRNPHELGRGQGSDSVAGQFQQSERGTSPANTPKSVLTDGTLVRLKFVRAVVSSQVIAGEKLPLEVVEPVLVGKLVAIPQHRAEEAIVTMAQAGRSMGRGGGMQFKIENICLADGELVPVRAVKDVKGGGNRALALTGEAGIATGFAFWPVSPLGFLIYVKGNNATIPAGTEITAYIVGDFPLDPSRFQDAVVVPQEKSAPK